jgi:Glycosyltransferases involved in cell wall biogenesis
MNNPVVSIITPSFNRADIIHETAASIFNQTYPFWEWIITDDGSTDNSWEVLNEFAAKDNRVKIYKREKELKGACACRNISVEKSGGDYLIFLDTDDLLASFCLEQRVKAMQEDSKCDFIIFPMLLFKKDPDDLRLLWNVETGENDLLRILKGDPICQGTGTLWKKSSFVKIGMWNVDLNLWQDIELHIRSILNKLIYGKRMDLPPDVFLRISDVSLSRTGFHSLPKLQSRIQVFSYAVETIEKQNLLNKYREGLRVMGYDIICSAIRSRHFQKAEELIKYCSRQNVFNAKEVRKFNQLQSIYKLRLYKIPIAAKLWEDNVQKIIPSFQTSITKTKWEDPIQF